jgi:hypothetical protein
LEEYIIEGDDYVDWLQWAITEELKNLKGCSVNVHVLNLVHPDHENMKQVVPFGDERWDEIQSRIKFDQAFSENQVEELWTLLQDFKEVFTWHKRELGCYTIGEHVIDTQGFPPCHTTLGRLSYWEEVEVNR